MGKGWGINTRPDAWTQDQDRRLLRAIQQSGKLKDLVNAVPERSRSAVKSRARLLKLRGVPDAYREQPIKPETIKPLETEKIIMMDSERKADAYSGSDKLLRATLDMYARKARREGISITTAMLRTLYGKPTVDKWEAVR